MNDKLNQVLKRQKRQVIDPSEKEREEIVQLVGFIVGDEEYAIPILNIQEIIKPIEYTRVPSVPEYVLGVFNLRGSVIPLIDLRKKFSLNAAKPSKSTLPAVSAKRKSNSPKVKRKLPSTRQTVKKSLASTAHKVKPKPCVWLLKPTPTPSAKSPRQSAQRAVPKPST